MSVPLPHEYFALKYTNGYTVGAVACTMLVVDGRSQSKALDEEPSLDIEGIEQ